MRIQIAILFIGLMTFANAYELKESGKESSSMVYTLKCQDGRVFYVRQEDSSGKWCKGGDCASSLPNLISLIMSSCK